MISAAVLFVLAQTPAAGQPATENWLLNTSASQKVDGDLGYTNKRGANTVTHKFPKGRGKDTLKMKLSDFTNASESVEVAKYHWTTNGTESHLVIRSIDKRVVGSYCGQSKSGIVFGTTYYPGALSKETKEDILGFYQRH